MQFLWAMSLRLTSSRFSGRRSRVVIRQIELTGCRIVAGTPVSVDLLRSLLIHTQIFFTFPYLLCKRIFCGIRQALGLVVGNVRNAEELEHFKQRLAIVTEGNGTVVRVALLNQDMAV